MNSRLLSMLNGHRPRESRYYYSQLLRAMNGNSVRILAECKHGFIQARKMSYPVVELDSCSVFVQNVAYF